MIEPYPRIPHLAPGPGITPDDLVLDVVARERLLGGPVRVEEKLDGANVGLWLDEHGAVQVASRGGPGAMDRAGQLGRLRAWAAQRTDALAALLTGGRTLYAEWLWLRHGIRYDRLPDLMIGLDVRRPDGSFAPVDERDRVLARAGIAGPPLVTEGRVATVEAVDALLGPARYASGAAAEGVVVRSLSGDRLVAKRIRSGFVQRSDAEWAGAREHNAVAPAPTATS